jgi:hypothetical protein
MGAGRKQASSCDHLHGMQEGIGREAWFNERKNKGTSTCSREHTPHRTAPANQPQPCTHSASSSWHAPPLWKARSTERMPISL